MRGQIQSPASKSFLCRNERTVCEACNPKLHSSTPRSLHPPNPHPQKLPRWPSPCIHASGYSSLPLQLPHTTLCLSVCVVCVYTHACIDICYFCIGYGVCAYLPFLKRHERAKHGKRSKKKGVCMRDRKESKNVSEWGGREEKGSTEKQKKEEKGRKERRMEGGREKPVEKT